MKKNLITLLTAALAPSIAMASAIVENKPSSPCGLVISETTLEGGSGASVEKMYPVTVNHGGSVNESSPSSPSSSSSSICNDTFTVKMHSGTTKSFKAKIVNNDRGYWYGEDETDGSVLNYMFNTETGDFITGSLNDMSSGEVVQFRAGGVGLGGEGAEGAAHLFAFVRGSNDFGAD